MVSSRAILLIFGIVVASAVAGPTNKEWKAAQAKKAADAGAAGADEAKMAAVNKVVTMLEDLQKQVLAEGEDEAATYNKFACFCKTTQKEKSAAIKTGKDDKTSLTADINKFSKERDGLDTKIGELQADIKKAEDTMARATKKSDKELSTYKTNEADMKAAISALQEAIKVLKASKSPSLVQLQSIGETIKQAALMADVLGLGGEQVEHVASFFLQQAANDVPVEMEDYKFHSQGIVKTLEKLLGDFRKEKSGVDADEVSRVQKHTILIQDRTDHVTAKTKEMNDSKKAREGKISDIGAASQELTTTSANLLDDMEYQDELNTICSHKAKTWDARSKVRADELTALTQATGIVKATVAEKTGSSSIRFISTGSTLHFADAIANSDSAMESIEAEAESVEEPLGFLQRKSVKAHTPEDGARQLIVSLLKGKGMEMHSALLTSLATRIAGDPFTKIKKLIQELIERLLTEAANESSQKGWCDKAMADATQKRTYSADEVEDLNAKMAKLAALSARLNEELGDLSDDTTDLKAKVADAEKIRAAEKVENSNTVTEANAGLDAVKMAIDILDKFYKTSAKAKVDLSLAQKGPLDDAPDAGFDNGEAYTGAGAESGGIIGMMEVIQSDFVRTISETKEAEAQAEDEHLSFMTESGKSLAEKKMATSEKTKLRDETDDNFADAEDSMTAQSKILVTSIKELIELKATCIDTGMSYGDRVAMREQEIASLKKALCILGAYAEFGPDGLADAC